jgi:hypothetical protein
MSKNRIIFRLFFFLNYSKLVICCGEKIYLVLAQEEGEGPFFEKKYLVIVLSKDEPIL